MAKKILGLDLGTNSIGWALVGQDFEKKNRKHHRNRDANNPYVARYNG